MSLTEECNEELFDDFVLSDDDTADLGSEGDVALSELRKIFLRNRRNVGFWLWNVHLWRIIGRFVRRVGLMRM